MVTYAQAKQFISLSSAQLVVGIIALGLTWYFFAHSTMKWWIYVLPHFVPPIFGFLAARFMNKRMVTAYMAFNIIALAGSIASFCYWPKTDTGLTLSDVTEILTAVTCVVEDGGCKCGDSDFPRGLCDILAIFYAVVAMMIIGWILCMAGIIRCFVSCCCTLGRTEGVV